MTFSACLEREVVDLYLQLYADTPLRRHADTFPPSADTFPPTDRFLLRRLVTIEHFPEEWRGPADFILGDFRRGTCGNDFSSGVAGFWTDIENVIGFGDNIEVML